MGFTVYRREHLGPRGIKQLLRVSMASKWKGPDSDRHSTAPKAVPS